jgi:hypothetical protein
MTSGPIRVLGLTKGDTGDGVIELWRSIIGPFEPEQAKAEKPESIRAMFGSRFVKSIDDGLFNDILVGLLMLYTAVLRLMMPRESSPSFSQASTIQRQ